MNGLLASYRGITETMDHRWCEWSRLVPDRERISSTAHGPARDVINLRMRSMAGRLDTGGHRRSNAARENSLVAR
jgi:hypothetical protein